MKIEDWDINFDFASLYPDSTSIRDIKSIDILVMIRKRKLLKLINES